MFDQIASERSQTIEQARGALAETIVDATDEAARRITAERQAAVEQLFQFLGAERTLLLDDIESRQDELRGLMTDVGGTISASGDLAHELTGTIDAIDRVVSRFDTEPDADREPLDMKDFRDAAAEAKLAARELTQLLEETDQFVASEAWDLRVASIVAPANSVIDRAFRFGVLLIALLIVGLGVMLLVVGFILNRFIVRTRHQVSVA